MKTKVKVLLLLITMFSSALGMKAQLTVESGAKYYLKHNETELYLGSDEMLTMVSKDKAAQFELEESFGDYSFKNGEKYICIDANGYACYGKEYFLNVDGSNTSFTIKDFFSGTYLFNYSGWADFGALAETWSLEAVDGEGGGGPTTTTRTLCRLISGENMYEAAPTMDNGSLATGGYDRKEVSFSSTNYNSLWYAETTDDGATCKLVHANSGYYLVKNRVNEITLGEKSDAVIVTGKKIEISSVNYIVTDIDIASNPIEYTLNGSGIGTLCLPFDFYADVKNPTDDALMANIVKVGNAETLNLSSSDCSQFAMKKNEGYIMVGKPGATYIIRAVENQETADTDGNLLTGSLCRTQMTPSSFYGLKTTDATDGELGTAVLALATTSAIPANKAYLNASNINSGISQFVLNFNDEESTTAINQLVSHSYQQSAAYDLAGRRISATCKGISIANGKKVIK